MIPVSELLALYAEIESGNVRLTALQDPQNVYAGNVVYVSGNGWTLTIFNDANEFDYVDEVASPDGRVASFAHRRRLGAERGRSLAMLRHSRILHV
jgi:hypothetical protein